MTRLERDALGKILRQRAKVAGKLAADLVAKASEAATSIDRELANRCRALGIPESFRPRISFHWQGRGENAFSARRTELRKAALARIDAMTRKAAVEVETATLEAATRLVTDALESDAARAFLETLPTVEAIMSPIRLDALPVPAPSTATILATGCRSDSCMTPTRTTTMIHRRM
jgi:hypothetical protein